MRRTAFETSDLHLRPQSLEPVEYVNWDYFSDASTRKSTICYVFMMAGAAESWCSSVQEVVALSASGADYVSLCTGVKEALWLRRLVVNLKLGL